MARISLRYDRQEFGARVMDTLTSLQILPKDPYIYMLAGVHRSVLNEASEGYTESNERLEYLGDAVLELTITEFLFRDFADKLEWELTDIRSALVRGRNLASISSHIGLWPMIQLSRGEYNARGHENPYILANTLEALIGALYLDQGFDVTKAFIRLHIYSTLPHILEQGLFVDPKSFLQELTQGIWGITPTYMITGEEGQDHNKIYIISAVLDGIILGTGRGSSKKKAEQDAAENAVSKRVTWEREITLTKKAGI